MNLQNLCLLGSSGELFPICEIGIITFLKMLFMHQSPPENVDCEPSGLSFKKSEPGQNRRIKKGMI